jgi:hypothetical protein
MAKLQLSPGFRVRVAKIASQLPVSEMQSQQTM